MSKAKLQITTPRQFGALVSGPIASGAGGTKPAHFKALKREAHKKQGIVPNKSSPAAWLREMFALGYRTYLWDSGDGVEIQFCDPPGMPLEGENLERWWQFREREDAIREFLIEEAKRLGIDRLTGNFDVFVIFDRSGISAHGVGSVCPGWRPCEAIPARASTVVQAV
jgi:hypothetical protein